MRPICSHARRAATHRPPSRSFAPSPVAQRTADLAEPHISVWAAMESRAPTRSPPSPPAAPLPSPSLSGGIERRLLKAVGELAELPYSSSPRSPSFGDKPHWL